MHTAVTVLEAVAAVLLVMVVGALLRRRGVLTEESSAAMARVVADVAFPALCLDGLARADAGTLRAGAPVVLLGFATLAVAAAVGIALARALGVSARARPTVVFAIAIGNWIFLPLPVAQALFGDDGTRAVILNNVGAQLFLWTFGLMILGGGKLDGSGARAIAMSPGLWATLIGIALALFAPPITGMLASVASVVGDALHAIASLTIPLVSIAIGAQLAAPSQSRDPDQRALATIVIGRMLAAPIVVSASIELARRAHWLVLADDVRLTEHLIAAMPVSLSAAALVQRYDGETALVSRAILITTLLAVVSAPLWMLAIGSFS